ncbi:beta strand repeat-containing protein [Methanolobus sp. WCC5]|uniref:beta strand repeat-containing protein n=1 Tax=Methanolobus sp. WCC5 TaxID=3125785 RepID=UPI0032451557
MSGIRRLTKVTMLLLLLVCMTPGLMAGADPNVGPNTFVGTVMINDTAAPVGTVIEAYIDYGTLVHGSTTITDAGNYTIHVSPSSSSDVGKTITFKVKNINATQTSVFLEGLGHVRTLNLTAYDYDPPVTTIADAPSGWQNSSFTINLTATDEGSGVNSTFYKVNDGSWTSGTSVLIDTDGNNTVMYYSVDNVGNVESNNTVYAKLDTTAPVTTDDAPVGWQNSSFTITLTASDVSGSGVNSTFYKVNDGSWISGTSVLIDTDGNNTVTYYSVDNVGNVESNNTVYAELDTTAPVVYIDPVTTPTNVSSQTINGSVVDVNLASVTVNGVSASLDGNNYSATIDLTEGANTITVVAVDSAGNSGSNSSTSIVLDAVIPVVYIDPVTTPTNVSSQTINGSVVDVNLASVTVNGVSASLDGNNYSATIDLTEGANTITVVAVDSAGNSGSNSSTSIVLDAVIPVVYIDPVTTPTNVSSQTINGSVVDVNLASVTVNGVSASLDGNNYSATIDLTEGANTITVVAVDSAGNSGSNSSISIVLDTVIPVVYIDPMDEFTNVSSQTITGTVDEINLASVTVNGASASLAGANYSATIDLTEGENNITVVATDNAGNTGVNSTSIVLNLGPDPVPPVLSDLTIVPGKILNITTDSALVTVNVTDEISGLKNVTIDLSEIAEPVTEMTYLGNDIYSYSISTQMAGNFSFTITAVDNADNSVTSSQFYLNVTTSDEVIGTYSGGDGLSVNEIEQAIADNGAGLVSDRIVLALIEDYFR